jgi:hypothetical protein
MRERLHRRDKDSEPAKRDDAHPAPETRPGTGGLREHQDELHADALKIERANYESTHSGAAGATGSSDDKSRNQDSRTDQPRKPDVHVEPASGAEAAQSSGLNGNAAGEQQAPDSAHGDEHSSPDTTKRHS